MKKRTIGTFLMSLSLFVFTPSMAGYASAKPCADQPNGRAHPIHVSAPKNVSSKPKVDKKDVDVCTGDFVIWTGPKNFAVEFKGNRTPSDKVKIPSGNGAIVIRITKMHVPGGDNRYDYNVVVPGRPTLDPGIVIAK